MKDWRDWWAALSEVDWRKVNDGRRVRRTCGGGEGWTWEERIVALAY